MQIRVHHFVESKSLKAWRSISGEKYGFLLINLTKQDLRDVKQRSWNELVVKVSSSVVLENGEEYTNVAFFQLLKSKVDYSLIKLSVKSYLNLKSLVEDISSFEKMHSTLSSLFQLTDSNQRIKAQGLFGELKFIDSVLPIHLEEILLGWQSDTAKTTIDFNINERLKVEVKTVGLQKKVRYNGISQIVPPSFSGNYYTALFEVSEGSETIQHLYDSIKQKLSGHLLDIFERRIAICSDYGYQSYLKFGFKCHSIDCFSMSEYKEIFLPSSIVFQEVAIDVNGVDVRPFDYVLTEISKSLDQ